MEMIRCDQIESILKKGKPSPADVPWYGEPNLGGYYGEEEIEAVVKVLRESTHWSVGFSSKSKEISQFEEMLADYCGAKYAVALTNCGAGLELALRTLDLKPGDEVICPAVNYKAAHMAVIDRGAQVVFCDIDPVTFNIDPSDVVKRITSKTRAIIPVHLHGLSSPIDKLEEIAEEFAHNRHGPLKIIGDAARACGAGYKEEKVGATGWATCFSFHSQKLITTLGEGGALVTNDSTLAQKVRDMCFYGGETGWGMNYRMNKVQAAVGMIQLKRLDKMINQRRKVAKRRTMLLSDVFGISLPVEPVDYYHAYYVYPIMVKP